MKIQGRSCRRALLATALASFAALCSVAAGAAPPDIDAITERVRNVIREDRADSRWGADPPAEEEIATRGEPFAATVLSGSGHALVVIGKDGQPMGSHLRLLHVSVEGDRASASECVLRLGEDDDRSCPPEPLALVDCATWRVPAGAVRPATLAARAALFVRVYEKKFIGGPREEIVGSDAIAGGISGSISGSTSDFLAVANVMESGEPRIRVAEEWAGYPSSTEAGHYVREYLTPKGKDPSDLRTRTYALEALARRTGRDTRCDGNRRLTDAAAAAARRRQVRQVN